MEVSELRIGNFINCIVFDEDENGKEKIIQSLGKFIGLDPFENYWWVESDLAREFYDEFHPIPLTEEWLVRFGFEKRKFSYLYGYGNFLYDYRLKLWTWYGIQLHDYLITYVHQLQNLYFALTGQELEISE